MRAEIAYLDGLITLRRCVAAWLVSFVAICILFVLTTRFGPWTPFLKDSLTVVTLFAFLAHFGSQVMVMVKSRPAIRRLVRLAP